MSLKVLSMQFFLSVLMPDVSLFSYLTANVLKAEKPTIIIFCKHCLLRRQPAHDAAVPDPGGGLPLRGGRGLNVRDLGRPRLQLGPGQREQEPDPGIPQGGYYLVSTQYLHSHSIYTVSTLYLHSIYFKVLAKEPHLAGLERDEWLAQVSCRVLQF